MSNLVQLFVFRHGETDWNLNKKFQGHSNIPLNQKGRDQAQQLRDRFDKISLDVCLCSDLDRAVETGRIAMGHHPVPFLFSSSLRETHLGDVEGMSQIEIAEKYGEDTLTRWRSVKPEDITMGFANGETKQEHLKRLKEYIEEMVKSNRQFRRVAVSTHGGSLVRLVHATYNAPEQVIQIPNCCLYELEFSRTDGSWKFIKYHQ